MTAPVGIGVVGCGRIVCDNHLPALRRLASARLVAVADPEPQARARASRLAGGAAAHDRPEAVFADPAVDAVVVAAPPALHAELVEEAAGAGKHVYVEKPLATGEAAARRAVDAVERAGVVGVVGFNRRRHPLVARARAIVASGAIGEVRAVQTAFCEPVEPARLTGWRRARATGGGVLLDLGSHHLDLVRWLLGTELEVAAAGTSSDAAEQDGAWVELLAGSGTPVQSVFSYRGAHVDAFELVGERGVLRFERHRASLTLQLRRSSSYGVRPAWPRPGLDVTRWRVARLAGRGGDPSYARSLGAFADRVRGKTVETPSLADGLASLRLVLAAERAAAGA